MARKMRLGTDADPSKRRASESEIVKVRWGRCCDEVISDQGSEFRE
jgi:hypothetical protein